MFCLHGTMVPEEGAASPGTGDKYGCKTPCGFWELLPSSLQEPQVLSLWAISSAPQFSSFQKPLKTQYKQGYSLFSEESRTWTLALLYDNWILDSCLSFC